MKNMTAWGQHGIPYISLPHTITVDFGGFHNLDNKSLNSDENLHVVFCPNKQRSLNSDENVHAVFCPNK